MAEKMFLTILTPEKVVLEKEVSKVSLPGTKGRFMVLWNHAPIISSLERGTVVFTSDGADEKVEIESGFVEVAFNRITVCAEI